MKGEEKLKSRNPNAKKKNKPGCPEPSRFQPLKYCLSKCPGFRAQTEVYAVIFLLADWAF